MTTLLIIIHVLASLFLISVVLLQSGKGAEIGATFGGSSQTLFGGRGAASFLSKLTTAAAVVFMLTSLALTMITSKGTSVIRQNIPAGQQKAVPQQTQQVPAPPQQLPAQPQPAPTPAK